MSILISGGPQSGKQWLLASLRKAFPSPSEDTLTLATKYYTVSARVTISQTPLLSPTHAWIIVLSDQSQCSLDFLREAAVSLSNTHLKPEVLICVVNKLQSSETQISEEIVEWTVQNGFEVVGCGVGEEMTQWDQRSSLMGNETEVGLKRVVEALVSCEWPGMELRQKNAVEEMYSVERVDEEEAEAEEQMSGMLDQLDSIISKVRSVRDMGSSVADPERRRLAAQTAMELWKVMFGEETDLVSSDEE